MYEKKFIGVGEIYVATKPTEIVTVLGSCIAVCLYDPVNKFAAMNHYLVPLWNGNGLQSPKYGNVSIPKMIEKIISKGSRVRSLQAKVFGGGNINNITTPEMLIGKKNILIAKEILKEYNIKVVANDVGGFRGRRIMMRSDTGKVTLKYAQKS